MTLQNGDKYLHLGEEEVGAGDEASELKVLEEKDGCVAFESATTEGRYISVGEDGSVQPGSELGPSTHFTPSSAEKKEEAKEEAAAEEEAAQQEAAEEATVEKEVEEEIAAVEAAEQKEEEEEGGGNDEEETVEKNEEQAPSDS